VRKFTDKLDQEEHNSLSNQANKRKQQMNFTTLSPQVLKALPVSQRKEAFSQFVEAGYSVAQALRMCGL